MRGANPYLTTPSAIISNLTCGQWVHVEGYAKPGRFVSYNADGTAYVVKPTGRGRKARVNMNAFRLACNKHKAEVLGKMPVSRENRLNGHIVKPRQKDFVNYLKSNYIPNE